MNVSIKNTASSEGEEKGKRMARLFEEAGFDITGRVLPRDKVRLYRDLGERPFNPDRMKVFVEKAEAAHEAPLPVLPVTAYMDFQRNGNRSRYEGVLFERRNRMLHLAFAEIYERRGRFTERLIDEVWATLEESTWLLPAHDRHNPNHSARVPATYGDRPHGLAIFSATCGALLSMIYHYLKDELDAVSPVIRERIAYQVNERVIEPFIHRKLGFVGDREHRPNNW